MRPRHRIALAVAGLSVIAGAVSIAQAAQAASVPENGRGGLLRLDADPYPAENLSIARGERVVWPVTAELDAPSAGELTVRVESARPLAESADGLRFALGACAEPWDVPAGSSGPATCGSGEWVIVSDTPFADAAADQTWSLGRILPGEPRYFLITLFLPLSTPGALASEPAELAFGFAARAVDAPVGAAPAPGLPVTGVAAGIPLLVAGGLLLGGIVLVGLVLARHRAGEVPR